MKKVINIVLNDFTNDSRVLKVSKSLLSLGFDPIVVAMHNTGLVTTELVHGFNVQRVKLFTRSLPKWKPIQLIKYFEFLFRVLFTFKKVDVVHCNDLNTLPLGLLIKICGSNVKVIYDCHEYETETNGLKGIRKKIKKILEGLLIAYADAVITVSDAIANEYSRLYNISKPYIILNCPAFSELKKQNLFRDSLCIRDDQTIFLYQGRLSNGRGIELLLEAFSDLPSDKNVLVCMGYGPLQSLVHKKAQQHKTVFFHPAVKPEILLNYTSSANYGVSFIEDTCLNYRYCLPNKIFEYIMAGLPVITSNLFEMKQLVKAERVGIVAEENTVAGFRKALQSSLDQDYELIQRNVFEARKKYCWEVQVDVLKEVYNAL